MKDKKMSIRISEDDLNIVHYKAKQAKLTLTEYVTQCALDKQIFVIDGVSGDTSSAGGADSDSDLDLDGELPITGWESERELLTATLLGGTDDQTQSEADGFGFTYPDYPADHLGIDSAYLAADMMNILDNDSHTEDCTTQKQPPKNKKNTHSMSM